MKVFGLWERLTRIIFYDGKPITVEPEAQTGSDKTITIPNVDPAVGQQIVLSAQQQTLTNKTIDAAGTAGTNTITNIKNASVASDAAIAGTKVAPDFGTQLVETDGSVSAGISLITNTIDPPSETLQVSATGAFRLPVGNSTTERPTGTAADLKGMLRYNDTDDVVEMYKEDSAWTVVGTDGSTSIVTQVAHGFVEGDVLYVDETTSLHTKAKADYVNTAEVVGVVKRVFGADSFELSQAGEINNLTSANFENPASLPTAGVAIFLSPNVEGKLTTTEPTTVGQISAPVGVAKSSTSIYVQIKRGAMVGSVNVRTRVSLPENAITIVQDVSQYDAGKIEGSVYIKNVAAGLSRRFIVSIEFTKAGPGGGYYLDWQAGTGEAVPVGLDFFIDAAGIIRATLPGIVGFDGAYIDYAINAPAIGTALPLTVNSYSVYETVKAVSSAYVITETDSLIVASGASTYTITLPSAVTFRAKTYTIKSYANAGVDLTITAGGFLIDNSSTYKLEPQKSLTVTSNGSKWVNLSAPVNEGRGVVPLGAIIAIGNVAGWTLPATGQIKDGYAICDGQAFPTGSNTLFTGTMPNLTDDRFLNGTTVAIGPGATGGATAKTTTGISVRLQKDSLNSGQNNHTHGMDHRHVWMEYPAPGSGGFSNITYNSYKYDGTSQSWATNFYGATPGASARASLYDLTGDYYVGTTLFTGPSVNLANVPGQKTSTDNATATWVNFVPGNGSTYVDLTTTSQGTISDIRPNYFNVVYVMRVV